MRANKTSWAGTRLKDKWNYCNHMPMLSLLGANHCLPLFHMPKCFIWLNETKQCINKFTIVYMINPHLYINKAYREKVHTFMNTTFYNHTTSY